MYYAILHMDNEEKIVFEYEDYQELMQLIIDIKETNFVVGEEKGKDNNLVINTDKIVKIELIQNIDGVVSNFIL